MQHGHGVIVALEQAGDAVRAVLRPAEDEHRIVIHALRATGAAGRISANRKRDK